MTSETNSHVSPEPIEAPEPRPQRKRDLVLDKAARLGWEKFQVEQHGLGSFPDFKAALALAFDYYLTHNRRAK